MNILFYLQIFGVLSFIIDSVYRPHFILCNCGLAKGRFGLDNATVAASLLGSAYRGQHLDRPGFDRSRPMPPRPHHSNHVRHDSWAKSHDVETVLLQTQRPRLPTDFFVPYSLRPFRSNLHFSHANKASVQFGTLLLVVSSACGGIRTGTKAYFPVLA